MQLLSIRLIGLMMSIIGFLVLAFPCSALAEDPGKEHVQSEMENSDSQRTPPSGIIRLASLSPGTFYCRLIPLNFGYGFHADVGRVDAKEWFNGRLTDRTDIDSEDSLAHTFQLGARLSLGGALLDNLVLHGDFAFDISPGGKGSDGYGHVHAMVTTGPGMTWYFNEVGSYLTGGLSFLYDRYSVTEGFLAPSLLTDTYGFAIYGGVGREWQIYDGLAIGIGAWLNYAYRFETGKSKYNGGLLGTNRDLPAGDFDTHSLMVLFPISFSFND